MTSLVENLLSLARADGGAESLALAPIRIDALFLRLPRPGRRDEPGDARLSCRVARGEDLVLLGDAQGVPRLLSILLRTLSSTPPLAAR